MKKTVLYCAIIMAILCISHCSLMTYTPADAADDATRTITRAPTSFKWLIADYLPVSGAAGTTTYTGALYEGASTPTEVVSSPAALGAVTILAMTEAYTCAILKIVDHDDAIVTTTVWDMNALAQYKDIKDLVPSLSDQTFAISEDCKALKIDDKVYHYDNDNSVYAEDTTPAQADGWESPQFDTSFTTAVTKTGGIYEYEGTTYTSVRADTFYTNTQVFKEGTNIVIFSWELASTDNYTYKLQINDGDNIVTGSIGEESGSSSIEPTIKVSSDLTKIVVQGKDDASANIVIIKSVNWGESTDNGVVTDVTFPDSIKLVKNYITLNQDYLYARNLEAGADGNQNHSVYAFISSSLVKLLNEEVDSTDWIKSLIIVESDIPLLIHETYPASVITLTKEVKTLKELKDDGSKAASPALMSFTYTGLTTDTTVMRSENNFNWLYGTGDDPTKLTKVVYSQGQTDNKVQTVTGDLTGTWTVLARTETLSCLILHEATSGSEKISMFKIVQDGADAFEALNNYAEVETVKATPTSTTIEVAENCTAFRVGDKFYLANGADSGDKFTLQTTTTFSGASVDDTFNVVINGQKLLYLNGNAYADAVTSEFNAINQIELSDNKDRIFVLSTQEVEADANYSFVVRLFVNSASTWTEVDIDTSGTSTSVPTLRISPDFTLFSVNYVDEDTDANIVISKKIDSSSNVSTMAIPQDWVVEDQETYLRIDNQFAYFRKIQKSGSAQTQFHEAYYSIDSTNNKFTQLSRKAISQAEQAAYKKALLQVESSTLSIITQYEADGIITLIKTELGSVETQEKLDNVESKNTGLLIKGSKIVRCPVGCASCTSEQVCSICSEGFVLDGSKCSRCKGSCASCAVGDLDICTGCFTGFYKSGDVCTKCHSNCLTCSGGSDSECTSCNVGSTGVSCASCPKNCEDCAGNSAQCKVCKAGYTASVDGDCLSCTSSCSVCDKDKTFECVACRSGFENVTNTVNSVDEISCLACPKNCNTCTDGICSECKPGYAVNNGTCSEYCQLPCTSCSTSDPTQCTECLDNYLLSESTCTPDISCNQDSSCTGCPIGYVFFNSECYACTTTDQNCEDCSNSDYSVCTQCKTGFYLDDEAACTACPGGCSECSAENTCSKCEDQYTLSGNSTESTCLACVSPCLTCYQSVSNCQSCEEGYEITENGWKCVKNTSVAYEIRVNAIFAEFTSTKLINLNDDLLDLSGDDATNITVSSVRSGSVVFSGIVETNNETLTEAALNSGLSQGGSLGGYTVEAVSFGTPSSSQDDDDNTTAILVGVLVPVAIIIICAVLFVLYKKGVICADGNSNAKVADTTNDDFANNNVIRKDPNSLNNLNEK